MPWIGPNAYRLLFASLALTSAAAYAVDLPLSQAGPDLTIAEAEKRAIEQCNDPDDFNKCVVATTRYIFADRGSKGYKDQAFTKELDYISGRIKADNPPFTMCVAAVAETAIEALRFYYKKTGDKTPFTVVPASSWNGFARTDIRSWIWENEGSSKSRGAGLAFATFGMGELTTFAKAIPGDFLSLDRGKFRPRATWTSDETTQYERDIAQKKRKLVTIDNQVGVWLASGHSTIFLGYLNKYLEPTTVYAPNDIIGFLYFSSQGSEKAGGFNYRWAIFRQAKYFDRKLANDKGRIACGSDIKLSARIDCNLDGIDRQSVRLGRLWHPSQWDKSKPQELYATMLSKTEEGLRKLLAADARTLLHDPQASGKQINIPSAKSVFGDPRQIESLVRTLALKEMERQNPAFDADRFTGETD